MKKNFTFTVIPPPSLNHSTKQKNKIDFFNNNLYKEYELIIDNIIKYFLIGQSLRICFVIKQHKIVKRVRILLKLFRHETLCLSLFAVMT